VDVTTLLLDTHAYVWALTDPNRLSDRARTAVADPSNVLLVSAATAWEMAIKHRAGKWPEAELLLAQHDDLLSRLGAELLAITAADAIRAGNLDWEHTDPFDRMLAAQALLRHATLLTRDEAFRDLRGLNILW
jgi:PIN domain nuclease of toxin-antitoxin system